MKKKILTIIGIPISFSPLIIFILASGILNDSSALNWSDGKVIAGIAISLILPMLFMILGESVIEDIVKAVMISPFWFILAGGKYELIGLAILIGAWGTTLIRIFNSIPARLLGEQAANQSEALPASKIPGNTANDRQVVVDDEIMNTLLVRNMLECKNNNSYQFKYTLQDDNSATLSFKSGDEFMQQKSLSSGEWMEIMDKLDEWFAPMSDKYPDTLRCRFKFANGEIYTLIVNGDPENEITLGINISR